MPPLVRLFTVGLVVVSITSGAATAQQPAAKPQAKPAAPARPAPVPGADEVLATVNGAKITKGQILSFLGQYTFLPGREAEIYAAALDALVNIELLKQYLDQKRVTLTEKEIDAELDKVRQQMTRSGSTDFATALQDMNISMAELRDRIAMSVRWAKHAKAQASEAALNDYFTKNLDLFNGTQVKASHILVKLEPNAGDEAKQKAREKLASLKKEIEEGKISFSAAANLHSDDDGNKETPDGGNLDYFNRRGQYIDAFCDAAFGLKPNQISDPVQTEFGYHLIQVTDRKDGPKLELAKIKDQVLDRFVFDLQNQVIADAKKTAKIEVKPMPANFFPPVQNQPQPAPANAAPAPATPKPAG